jgi:hypothetical protein
MSVSKLRLQALPVVKSTAPRHPWLRVLRLFISSLGSTRSLTQVVSLGQLTRTFLEILSTLPPYMKARISCTIS